MEADPSAVSTGTHVAITFMSAATLEGVVGSVGRGWWRVDVEGAERGPDGSPQTVQRWHLVNLASVAYVHVSRKNP
jgi:hypothetical protein